MVVIAASRTAGQDRRRCMAATKTAPKVPMPAASTGVAIPVKIPPSTRTLRRTGEITPRSRRSYHIDRDSAVQGKTGSVRVSSGGSRLIQQKQGNGDTTK